MVNSVLERTSSVKEEWDELHKKINQHVIPDKKEVFEREVDLRLEKSPIKEEVKSLDKDAEKLDSLLEESEQPILPEQRDEVYKTASQILDSTIEGIDAVSTPANSYSKVEVRQELRQLRNAAQRMHRRVTLFKPPSQQEFEATLRWMAVRGEKEDLILIWAVRKDPLYYSELLETAEQKIRERLEQQGIKVAELTFSDEREWYPDGDSKPQKDSETNPNLTEAVQIIEVFEITIPDERQGNSEFRLLKRDTRIKFPSECILQQEVELRIQLLMPSPKLPSITLDKKIESVKLNVHITSIGFKEPHKHKLLTLPVNGDSEEIIFKLVPIDLGEQMIEIEFLHECSRVGYVIVETMIKDASLCLN